MRFVTGNESGEGPTPPVATGRSVADWELFDAAPDAILVVAADGGIAYANSAARAMFGGGRLGPVGHGVEELVPAEVRDLHRHHRADYAAAPAVRAMGVGLTLRARRIDGGEFNAEISLSPLAVGEAVFTVAAVRDITPRLAAEEALHFAEQRAALAEDRERIARDLHDNVIQRLFGTGLSLQAASGLADDGVRGRIESAIAEIDETILELRTTIFSLQAPRGLPDGLRGHLLEVASEAGRSLGFDPRVRFDGPIDNLPEPVADELVPVLREALSNVAKHARATRVLVEVAVGEEAVLTVTDDGVGTDGGTYGGSGLANLTSRAERLGGRMDVGTVDAGGCRLCWRVPVR
jgi:PAS domain S-box-containing protein